MNLSRVLVAAFVAALAIGPASYVRAQGTTSAPAAAAAMTVEGKVAVKKEGDKVTAVMLTTDDGKTWTVVEGKAKMADFAAHDGHEVEVTGTVDEKAMTVTVDSVKMVEADDEE